MPTLEELAGNIAGISRKAFEHAQSVIDEAKTHATDNWHQIGALVLEPTAPERMMGHMTLRIPSRPDRMLDALLRPRFNKQAVSREYGSLWEAGEPTGPLGPFQARLSVLVILL